MKLSGLFCLLLSCTLWAESSKTADFILLFNGTDLKGWVGQTEGYQAQDGVLTALPRKSKGRKFIRPRSTPISFFNLSSS